MTSMLEHAGHARLPTPITLLYGSHAPGEIARRSGNPRARVVYTASEPDAGWTGRVGRLGPELLG